MGAGNGNYGRQGLFDRVYEIFDLLKRLPDSLSDEEAAGLVRVLPRDSAGSFRSLLRPAIRPASLSFLRMLQRYLEEARAARDQGRKVVLLPFNFPPEIIHSFDNLFPLTSEVLTTLGVVALEGQGERYWDYAMGLGLPDHLCSANTIELGSMLMGVDFTPDAIISGCMGSCDVNAKTHEFVSHYLGIPQIPLERPPDNTARGLAYFAKSYRKMIGQLEQLAGEELREENLRRVAGTVNRCTELYDDLWELKKEAPCPVPGIFSLFISACRFTMWGREEAVRVMEECLRISRGNLASEQYRERGEAARVVWIYLSYYFDLLNFYDWMDEQRISNMGDALLWCFPQPLDLSSKDTILEGMINSAWNNVMTRQMGADSMSLRWVEDLVYVIGEWQVDTAIYCGHHSCKQTWSVFSIARNEIMRRTGVPTLGLQGDSWIRTMTPISAIQEEVASFINNVVVKRRRRRRSGDGPVNAAPPP